ncbi:MAG TPA: DUF6152 family protein [Vicinamibacterales bacterium]|nr:DUF6152 family protein [Vicinamibacterales bacterium]
MRFWLPALVVITVLPAAAHHPFTPFYDASKPASVTGVVAELRTINPHVVLIVDGQGPDGRTGLWAFEGFPPNALLRQGLKDYKDRLKPGTSITISGWPARDPSARAFSGRDVTFADGSTMRFGPTPEEADRWSCSPGPCPYKYPDVRSQ